MAAGLTIRESHRRDRYSGEVQRFVTDLCAEVADGGDPRARLSGTDSLIASPVLSRLRTITDQPGSLTVIATAGDTTQAGHPPQPASHTAVIQLDGRDMLGLRIVHEGPKEDIVIIGFWIPLTPKP